ncbi:unnamed protein product, partial [Porites evermanni]
HKDKDSSGKKSPTLFSPMHMHEPECSDLYSDGSCYCCDLGECCDCDKCFDFDKCCDFDDCFDCDDCCLITVTNDLNVTVVCDCDEYRDRKKFTDCDNCRDCN